MKNSEIQRSAEASPIGTLVREAYSRWGIVVDPAKKRMVESRLEAASRKLGVQSLGELVKALKADSTGRVETVLFDALSTNFTSFFREREHIDFLVQEAKRKPKGKLRFWSAGCSNGSEPYSLAMALVDALEPAQRADLKILASDLAISELKRAKAAVYGKDSVRSLATDLVKRHFESTSDGAVRVRERTRNLVTVASINLSAPWKLRGPFDAILCRNVMIYFDEASRQRLVSRFAQLLPSGGYLVIGLTESITGRCDDLRMVRPGVYVKTGGDE